MISPTLLTYIKIQLLALLTPLGLGMVCWLACANTAQAQELYVHTEPASNRPKGIWVVKPMLEVNQEWVRMAARAYYTVAAPLMLYGGLSSRYEGLRAYVPHRLLAEGAYVGLRWRMLSLDGPNRHLRLALGAELSGALRPVQHPPIHLRGQHTGGSLGLFGTGQGGGRAGFHGQMGLFLF